METWFRFCDHLLINKKTAATGKSLNPKPATRNPEPGAFSIQPHGHDHDCSQKVGPQIPDTGAAARNKGLVEFIAESVGKAKEDDENTGTQGLVSASFFWNCIEGGCGKHTIDQTVEQFVNVRNIGQYDGVARLVGKEENDPHYHQHGDNA